MRNDLLIRRLGALAIAGSLLTTTAVAQAARLTYDSANRLVRSDDGDVLTTFEYDGMGNLVRSCRITDSGQSDCSRLVVNDQANHARIVGQRSETTPPQQQLYAYDHQGVTAVLDDDQVLLPLADHQGSIRGWASADGELAGRVAYDPFGRERTRLGTTAAPGYTGEWTAADGSLWLRARTYLPDLGRFAQRDPFLGVPEQPESLNRYAYAQDNPLRYVDPSGNFAVIPFCIFLLGLGVSTASLVAVDTPALTPSGSPYEMRWDPWRGPDGSRSDVEVYARKLALSVATDFVGLGIAEFVALPPVRAVMRLQAAGSRWMAAAYLRLVRSSGDALPHATKTYGRSARLTVPPGHGTQLFGDCVICSIENIFRHANVPLPTSPVAARLGNARNLLFRRATGFTDAEERILLKRMYQNDKIKLQVLSMSPMSIQEDIKRLNRLLATTRGPDGLWQGVATMSRANKPGAHMISVYQSSAMAKVDEMLIYDSAVGRYIQVSVADFARHRSFINWTKATRIKPPTP